MKRKLLALAVGGLMVMLAGSAFAQSTSWIHVRVTDDDGARVNVNLPISLVEMALEIAGSEAFEHEHIHLGHGHDMGLDEVRRLWNELREAGDAEYVNAEDDNERVRVWREGDVVRVSVDHLDRDDDNVEIEVPMSIIDVLLQGEGNQLNLAGALRELASSSNGDILQVNDGDTSVRIWIDESNQD